VTSHTGLYLQNGCSATWSIARSFVASVPRAFLEPFVALGPEAGLSCPEAGPSGRVRIGASRPPTDGVVSPPTPCGMAGVTLNGVASPTTPCRMAGVTLHGGVSPPSNRASFHGLAFALSAPHTPSATCEMKTDFNELSNARQRGFYKLIMKRPKNPIQVEGLISSYTIVKNIPYCLQGVRVQTSVLQRACVRAQRPPHPLRYLRGEAAF
jgi:hypothetical protein